MQLFLRLRTQWDVGLAGPTRLIYASLYPLLDRMGLAPDDWLAMLDDIAAMEAEALKTIHANRPK